MESNMTEMIENLSDRKVLLHHICAETEDALVKLDTIWDRMGIDTDLREERAKVVLKHVKTLYKEMLAEAEDQQTKLINSIESLIQKLNALSKEMQTQISFDGYEETPLTAVKHELYQKLKKYDLMYQARKTEITDIMDEEQVLCLALGRKPKSLQISPLPKPEEVVEFRKHVDDLSKEKDCRQELFLKTKSEILEIIRELKIKPNLDFENKILTEKETEFILSDENMSKLAEYHKRLLIQLTETSKEITKLRETLMTLWKLLEECPEKQTNFLKSHVGTNMETLKAMKKEIARLEEKKRANIKIFVDKIREEIVNWWTLCRYSCAQRAEFKHFETNIYTEDLLSLHELYLEKLKNFYESNKAIFCLITKREQLWEKMLELERCANEPDRYKNRGGQLLREEKERKKVASRLPKIEQELLGLVDEYEGKVGERFLVNGEVVSDLIANMWASHREDKHLKLSAKKQAREQPTLTPMKSPMPLVQSRLTPAATPSKRKIALTLFGSGKRSKQTANIPKIQVNGSTIKRASMERKRKMEKRRKSKIQQNLNDSTTSSTTDYNDFEKAIAAKPACRSTLFSMGAKKAINTPRAPRQTNRTPSVNTPRPPSRNQLRPTTPVASTSQFSAVPGNLPIII